MSLFLLLSAKHNLLCLADSFVLYATVGFLHSFQRILFAYNPKNVA